MVNISVLKWNNVIFKQTRVKMLNTGESRGILS